MADDPRTPIPAPPKPSSRIDLSPGLLERAARKGLANQRWIVALLVGVAVVASVKTPAADWPTVEMPNVLGLDVPSAKEKIERLDLILGKVTEVPSDKTPRGIVMGQGPAPGTRVIK